MQSAITLNPAVSIKRISLGLSFRKFFIFSLFLIIAFLVFYIFQINNVVARNYTLQKMQSQLNALSVGNEQLAAQLAGASSLGNIENLIQNQEFEKINQVTYIQIGGNSVAIAK